MSHAYSWFPNERLAASVWRGHPPYLPLRVSAHFPKGGGPIRLLLHLRLIRRPPRDRHRRCGGSQDSHEYGEYFQQSGSPLN
jgi:hypothetical protein